MKCFVNPEPKSWEALIERPTRDYSELNTLVERVFQEVEKRGDKALIEFAHTYDKAKLSALRVSTSEIDEAAEKLSETLKNAIQTAAQNIRHFHEAQRTSEVYIETQQGVSCWQKKTPIEKVGIYIPGGTAPLFSTVLMLAIPATIAGCKEIVLCTPQQADRPIAPEILYAAKLCGVSSVHPLGGVQAIAALAIGTESVSKVYKIFGPGNQYVTAAKQYAAQKWVAIDMPAGPSELLVYGDETSIPSFIAADLLSQAEHGSDSQVVLVTTDASLSEKVNKELDVQLESLSRKGFAKDALENSRTVVFNDAKTAADFINYYAPEHYIIASEYPEIMLEHVRNAGSVFVGNFTPESAGDYASGTNHTLPTNGFARQYSGVNLDSYLKAITFQRISPLGITTLGPAIEEMARAESLTAHERAVTKRLEFLKGNSIQEPKFNLKERIQPHLRTAEVYSSARDEFKDKNKDYTWLDANENPFNTGRNRYPDPQQMLLKEKLAELWEVDRSQLFIGNGSDEVLELLFQLFAKPSKSNVVAIDPSYGMYQVLAEKYDIHYRRVGLDEQFDLDANNLLSSVDPMTAMVFICSPNNPTGNHLNLEQIIQVIERANTLVVVDEAYIDFSERPSLVQRLGKYSNLIVVRTLSKAYGLAGLRLGVAVTSSELVNWMNRIKPPYNVNALSQNVALERLQNSKDIVSEIELLKKQREELKKALEQCLWVSKVFPSDSNFILVRVDDATSRYNALVERGFVVRNRSAQLNCENTLRISVGTIEENKKLISYLTEK